MRVDFGKQWDLVSALPGPQSPPEQLGASLLGGGLSESSIRMEGPESRPKMVAAHFMHRQGHAGTFRWVGDNISEAGFVPEMFQETVAALIYLLARSESLHVYRLLEPPACLLESLQWKINKNSRR